MDSHFKTRALESGLLATSICPSPGFTPPTYEELEKQLEQLKPKQHHAISTTNPQTLQKSAIKHHKQGNLMELHCNILDTPTTLIFYVLDLYFVS